ncbi:hypothetical protein HZC32_00190 [Candidatus Woesearchaeota archaeon]|nr:hypothetical protein [Candidatus Woesearchaeota archaeon]
MHSYSRNTRDPRYIINLYKERAITYLECTEMLYEFFDEKFLLDLPSELERIIEAAGSIITLKEQRFSDTEEFIYFN